MPGTALRRPTSRLPGSAQRLRLYVCLESAPITLGGRGAAVRASKQARRRALDIVRRRLDLLLLQAVQVHGVSWPRQKLMQAPPAVSPRIGRACAQGAVSWEPLLWAGGAVPRGCGAQAQGLVGLGWRVAGRLKLG